MCMTVSLHVCASHECLGPTEARRGNGSRNWSRAVLSAPLWVVGLEPGFSGRGAAIYTAEPLSRRLTLFPCPGEDLLAKAYQE